MPGNKIYIIGKTDHFRINLSTGMINDQLISRRRVHQEIHAYTTDQQGLYTCAPTDQPQ